MPKVLGVFMFSSAALFLACALSLAPAGARDEPLTFTHKQRSLQPGEMILFASRSARPLKRLVLKAFSREFPAFTEDGGLQWTGLAGIDLDTKPGRYRAELFGIDRDGQSLSGSGVLTVAAKKFPTRHLTVEEKYVSPPANVLVRIEAERNRWMEYSHRPRLKVVAGAFRLPVRKRDQCFRERSGITDGREVRTQASISRALQALDSPPNAGSLCWLRTSTIQAHRYSRSRTGFVFLFRPHVGLSPMKGSG
jgi:hypothetical protein